MALTKEKKSEVIGKIKDAIKSAETVAFVSFHGLSVLEMGELRKKLRESAAKFMVVKKTLLAKVLGESGFSGSTPELTGEVGISFGPDAVSPAKGIAEFRRGKEDKLKLLGGIFEKAFMDEAGINVLASVPGREVLLGMFANVINSPISGLVIALDQISKKKS